MSLTVKLILVVLVFAVGGAAGLAVPAALAAGSATTSSAGAGAGASGAGASTSGAGASTSGAGASTSAASSSSGSAATSGPGFGLSNAEQNQATDATTTPAPVIISSSSSTSGGLSGTDAILIALVAVLLLSGIALWIWRDARSHAARVGHRSDASDPMFGGRSHAGSKAARKPRKPGLAERKRRKRGRSR